MNKFRIALPAIVLSGLVLSASPSFADNSGNGRGEGHDPVTICHNGVLISVDDDGAYNGHKNHSDDIFPETLGRTVTEADCAAVPESPAEQDNIIGSSQSLSYECTGTVSYSSGREETIVERTAVIDGAEVIQGCGLTPGDLPSAKPAESQPEAPVVPAPTPEVPSAVVGPDVQAVPAAPLATTGTLVSETKPTELAYTGFDLQSLLLGLGAVGLGIGALRLRKKLV